MYPLKFTGIFEGCLYKGVPTKALCQRKTQCFQGFFAPCSSYEFVAEQKARVTYDNILRLSDDPDVCDVIKFLRAREIVHYQRFGEALRISQDKACDKKNYYMYNPAFDKAGLDCKDNKNNGCGCNH